MTFLVPFDGTALSETALARAAAFAVIDDADILAVSVIPHGNVKYARERGWIESEEDFELETVLSTLRNRVADCCPEAEFRYELADRYAPSGTISLRIRNVAREVNATMVFIGSENAGRIVSAVGSVGAGVSTEPTYDVHIVRHLGPLTDTARESDPSLSPSG